MADLRASSETHRTIDPSRLGTATGDTCPRPGTRVAVVLVAALVVALLALAPTSASAGDAGPIPGGGNAVPVGIGDFDGDGRQEAALIVPGRSTVILVDVLTLQHEVRAVAGGGGLIGDDEPVGVADIDGDGRDDLVTTRFLVDVWYRGLRNGTFGRAVVLGTGGSTGDLKTVGSLDGFDEPEILASLAPSGISGQPLRFRGIAGELADIETDTGMARFMVAGRFEPDDREQLRLLVSRGGSDSAFVGFRKEGTSIRGDVLSDFTWTLSQTRSVVPGDIDGDGLDDLVVRRTDDSTLWVFLNDGTGDFAIRRVPTADDLVTESTVIVGATDINGDGFDDVVAVDGAVPFRIWGDATDLLVPDRPVTSVRRCAGRSVTVEVRFGEQPTDGDDVILGTPGDDVIDALGGNDIVCALGGDDIVRGARGNDILIGGRGNDVLLGNGGRDRLRGGPGDDRLVGGFGPDRLVGNRGDNTCIGGPGRDRLLRGC
ncbi:MAG: calcium-binding protein [Acidimicrobiales bacterium]